MIDLSKYGLVGKDLEFLSELYEIVCIGKSSIDLNCSGFCFQIDPCQELCIWHNGEMIGTYKDFDDLLFNFKIDGKPFLERVQDMDYD